MTASRGTRAKADAITLTVEGDRELTVGSADVALVGFSGRDSAAVEAHIRELVEHGMQPPASTPSVWTVPRSLVVAASAITAATDTTSGEAEPVLVRHAGEWLLGVGSDHTDRALEQTDMTAAKSACQKVIGPNLWHLAAVAPRWDDLVLASQVRLGDQWVDYQQGRLAELREPAWFMEAFRSSATDDAIVFCGTIPTLHGLVTGGTGFRASLTDPTTGQTLRFEYTYGSTN